MSTIHPNPAQVNAGQSKLSGSRKRRRLPRASRACIACRNRKTRCDQQIPCSNCSYYDLQCEYTISTPAATNAKEKVLGSRSAPVQHQQDQYRDNTSKGIRDVQRPQETTSTGEIHRQNSRDLGTPPTISPTMTDCQHQDPIELTAASTEPFVVGNSSSCEPNIGSQNGNEQPKGSDGDITGLGGVNSYTQGTEFYGASSNLAFLNALFARAKARARTYSVETSVLAADNGIRHCETESPGHLRNGHLSLVNLMYNAAYAADANELGYSETRSVIQDTSHLPLSPATGASTSLNTESLKPRSYHTKTRSLEQYFIDSYFSNKHYIHPFLDESHFRDRCSQLWVADDSVLASNLSPTFRALYYAVVAVGAINASIIKTCIRDNKQANSDTNNSQCRNLQRANCYFDLAHKALGNTFEISTLETCQALFLLTVFCQNALKPHSSYLYSGMAVRTATAIGITNKTYGTSSAVMQEARRTWWCIYSHEVEMCCSSGRVDGLKNPSHYSTPLPSWNESDTCAEDQKHAIIPIMVQMAQIMQAASSDIYHDVSNRSLREKSRISFELDGALDSWIKQLPSFLDFDSFALDDTEWTFKQKLVLKFRSYNARIIIHRPFLVASSASYDSSEFSRHAELCLEAARATIRVIHESLAHRPYLRTWWYCTTYTLYATMIILHLVLLDFPKVLGEELIQDVEKSLEIFGIMGKNVTVAKKCDELTREILGVAKRYLSHQRQKLYPASDITPPSIPSDFGTDIFGPTLRDANEIWDDEYLITLLNQDEPGPSRANALANFLDPSILQGFVVDNSFF